ncbi:hypothetical protein [Niabella aquatica]
MKIFCSSHCFAAIFTTILFFCINPLLWAQTTGKHSLTFNLDDLYSTHGDHFPGATIEISRPLSDRIDVSIATGFAYTPTHPDNGWEINNLLLIPTYLSQYIRLTRQRPVHFFVHLSQGLTILNYNKSDVPGQPFYHIREGGFYGYAGVGVLINIKNRISGKVEAGLKSYKLSFDDLDINPHGMAMSLGLTYRLSK